MVISNCNDVVILCNKMKRGENFKTHVSCLSCSFPFHEMPIKKESIIPKRDAPKRDAVVKNYWWHMVKIIIYWKNYHVTQRKIFYQVFEKSDQWVGKKEKIFRRKYSVHAQIDTATVRSSHERCSVRKDVPRNSANFTGKHLYQSLSSNKVPALRAGTLFKKRDWYWCFLVNFPKFLTPFLQLWMTAYELLFLAVPVPQVGQKKIMLSR